MFSIVAVPFDALKDLPAREFKTLVALMRYADKLGRCWPALRQLAHDIGVSESTACRAMQCLYAAGVFAQRTRSGNGRYRYQIAPRFLPRWPGKASRLAERQPGLAQPARPQSNPTKQGREARSRPRFGGLQGSPYELPDMTAQWQARITSWRQSGGKFWLPQWGEKPGCHGCLVPPELLRMTS